ncbi:InTestinal NeureXin-like [Caenorhabditis elegans]|uniref:InTestinal NeureXin-like n=2 Tax=Caenorhabditis elegans TaxID=6239 RepID=A0A078BS63_CAEEL|nr:InTestinal NeureXin-like [Caenorhabditis elegans]CDX47479.1 InTestinal NeureXin-like [Caenorhabditis elegans]|eukprot:NP_001293382.1 InTestinal NeureXin-like [Caenorhabditis elegans]
MWQLLVPLAVLLTVSGQSTDEISHERIFLKYPSSFVNFTSDNWKLTETDNQLIIAVKFQASSHIGQIFSVRFINPDGSLKALLTAGIAAGILQINLYDDKNTKILNKPMENSPINVHEHSLAVGLNTTARNLWYKLGADNDLNCEINQAIDISNTEVTVTIGGGSQSMIGCVSIVAVSAGESSPVSQGTPIAYQDIDECPKADACTTKDCNTGRCIQLEVPTCDCYGTEMAGPNCRLPAPTIQLRNNDENEESSAYLRYKPWEMDSHFSRLSMDFRFSDSDAKEGILVYGETSQGKIFKIYVVGTKGKVMLDTTNVADFELREDHSIFHSIIVKIVDGIFNMLVDDNVHRRAFNESDALVFDTIQFGAPIPTDVSEVGVTACVKNVYVDHVDIIELAVLTNDSRTTASRVRSCNNEDLTEFQGPSLFSADPLAEILVEDPSDIKSEFGESVIGADMFPVPSNKKPKTQPLSSCEKANAYMCQNGAGCKKESETEFTCFCKEGYIGKFCQFTTIPRSCAEAYDFLKLPNGATWVDVDGNRKLDPSVTMCTDGQTEIPHDMKPGYVVRDTTYQNHSLFVLSYRDFNSWQLAKYIKNSGSCSQTVNYRCNKAPLRFKEGKTWFKSVSNATEKIKQIGMLPNSCPCLDRGCQSGEKCNCDSGAISEDIGELTGRYSGICEVVTLFDEADVRAEMTISELKCSGYENEKPIRFTERTELKISDWTGESIDLQFRTTETPASLVTVQGNYGEKIISVSLTDGHTVQISNFEALKIIESQTKLNDSNWHHVLIELADGEIRVTVDATHVLMTIGDNAVLEGSVVLGGEGDGLIGCVRNVLINDEPVNLQEIVKTSEKTGITETCDTRCTADFCQNGAKCYEDFVSGMPFCQCAFPDVHSGVNCEIDINTNSSVSFHGGYLKFDDVKNVLNAPIYFSFRTDRTHALLFFAHDQNNNFLQVHLSEEVNVTLTLNNLDIVSQCTVRAQPGTEYGDMRWIQVAITHDSKSSQLQVDDAACTIRTSRVLSEIPITRLLDVYNSELVGMPVGLAAPVKPNPYTFTFIGNVNTGEKTNDGSFILAPKYESPIPRFYGCIRGFQINREMIDMREKTEHLATSEMYEAYGPALVKVGCEVGCSSITCLNGGHCSVAWANTDPSAATTTCDCSRTSYTGASCSLDEGVHMERSGFIEFDISKEMARYVFIEQNSKIPQLLKFAFSSSPEIVLKDKSMLALVVFREKQKLEIEINPNRTINVAITYENGKSDVLNFVGDFLDGYRHFVVVQTNQASATAVMIDSLRQDFEYRGKDKNIDLFNAERIRIGGGPRDRYTETDGYLKAGYTGCISNFIVDYQRGSSLTYKPITYFANPTHHLSKLIMTNRIVLGGCAAFEVPNSLPVYQNRVKFPVWDTEFRRFVYFRDVEPLNDNNDTEWTDEDSGSLMWVVFIIFVLGVIFLIIFCIFMKCCREKIHARDDEYLHDEDIPLHMAPTILRHPQPSPPPIKKSAASNYKIPNPNIDFNKDEDHTRATSITSSGISGYFTAQENTFDYDDEDEFAGIADDNVTDDVTVRNEVDDSDNETIRHIDDEVQDEDGMVIVSRPTQVSHLPQRVSSFRTGDPTAPKDSPLYSNIRPPTSPIHASVPVPPPRMSNNSPFA